jgi:hypothetical protein
MTVICNGHGPFPNGHKSVCNGYVTTVAVGQSQRLRSGVRCLPDIISASSKGVNYIKGLILDLGH